MPNITLVVAMDRNMAIGKDRDIPWRGHLRRDMEHFKETTLGKTVLIGRLTYESIPEKFRPLRGRTNIIFTRNREYSATGCVISHSVEEICRLSETQEVMVIGGGQIYELFLPHAQRIIATLVETIIDGDTFFPDVYHNQWGTNPLFVQHADEKNVFSFSVVEYVRV
ncbi:MAG: dihydrofolate reductase [Minisyncoccia bacterium]